jgi:hypothetical protein
MAIELLSAQTNGVPPPGEPLLTASSYESAVAAVDALAGGGRRDVASARSLQAERYVVMLSGGDHAQPLQLLRQAGMPAAGGA